MSQNTRESDSSQNVEISEEEEQDSESSNSSSQKSQREPGLGILSQYFSLLEKDKKKIIMKCVLCPEGKQLVKGTPYHNFYRHIEVTKIKLAKKQSRLLEVRVEF